MKIKPCRLSKQLDSVTENGCSENVGAGCGVRAAGCGLRAAGSLKKDNKK